MKGKKYILLFVFLFIIILVAGLFYIKKLKGQQQETAIIGEEYTPEAEITEEQMQNRETVVTVYFPSKETGKIMPEARDVDVREIVNNPYQRLMELLIEGPKSEKLEKVIPENTMILGSNIQEDCVTVNVSSEILNYDKENPNAKENLIESIVSTLKELAEVSKVKILVEGQENPEFSTVYE